MKRDLWAGANGRVGPKQQELAMPVNLKRILVVAAVTIPSIGALLDYHERDLVRDALRSAVASCMNVTIPSEPAIAACSAVIRSDAKAAWAYTNRGLAYSSNLDQDRAIADLDTAIGINPTYAMAYAVRAAAYGVKWDWNRALADNTRAIELNPAAALSYSNRAAAYVIKGEYGLAIADATKAIEIDPKLAAAYMNRGDAAEKIGDFDRAIADYREALRLDPGAQPMNEALLRLHQSDPIVPGDGHKPGLN
jgi:tetratricopeptide (TPR) repeat protein